MSFSLFVHRCGGEVVVDVDGEVDVISAPWLQQRLLHLLRADGPHLLVDLSGATFIDCFATRLLIETCRRAEQQACSIQFVALSKQVQRLAELAGLTGELPVTGPCAAGQPSRGARAL
jgi:anti-sigma B factor antagonist